MKQIRYRGVILAGVVVVAGCGTGSTQVTATSVQADTSELFWAKNQLAEQTDNPGGAEFRNFEVLALSNGDRVYCGEMSAIPKNGAYQPHVPFYMRARGTDVKAVNTVAKSADFSTRKCAEARRGSLRINNV